MITTHHKYQMTVSSKKCVQDITELNVTTRVVTGYSNSQQASPLRDLTCHMRSYSVTWLPAEVTFRLCDTSSGDT